MSSQNIPVSIRCGKCGSNDIPIPDNPDESFIVKCNACGTVLGTWSAVKCVGSQHVAETVQEEIKNTLREAFKDSKNFRVE